MVITAPTKPSPKPFAEILNFEAMFGELEAVKHIVFTPQEKEQFKEIVKPPLKHWDGNRTLSDSLGASSTGWLFSLFAGIQNAWAAIKSALGFGDGVSKAVSQTGDFSNLHDLNQATVRIDMALKQAGGKFAQVADIVSGQSENGQAPEKMQYSIYSQIRDGNPLPLGSSTSLNGNNVGKQFSRS